MAIINQFMGLLKAGLGGFGLFYIVMKGVIPMATALQDHNGPEIKNAILGFVGGAILLGAIPLIDLIKF